ncbi:hypothetical protein A2U01_0018080, partial [Trifolium medium]|nr:hypothetical protein [Trifolium medium]
IQGVNESLPTPRIGKVANNSQFYNDLLYNTRMTIDAAAGGTLMNNPFNDAYGLIEDMAQNHYQWGSERAPVEKSQPRGGMYEVSSLDHLNAKFDAFTQKIDSLSINPAATVAAVTPGCELCGTSRHVAANCQLLPEPTPDQVNYAQGNPFSNTYNPGWSHHPNLSYKNNNSLFAPSPAPTAPPGFQN